LFLLGPENGRLIEILEGKKGRGVKNCTPKLIGSNKLLAVVRPRDSFSVSASLFDVLFALGIVSSDRTRILRPS